MTRQMKGGEGLFIEGSGQLRLIDKSLEQLLVEKGKVECLGQIFDSEEARRVYFIDRLRDKLTEPAFRSILGFPMGADEDILKLSNPPYYTACPNPFIKDLILSHRGAADRDTGPISAYTSDVSSSKADIIYTAHSYHTKVPPNAIAT
jgi:hypothetical protein